MDKRREKQLAKLAGVNVDLVQAIISAELLRIMRELIINNQEWAVGIYGDIVKISDDVYQLKISQEFLDMINGDANDKLLETLK